MNRRVVVTGMGVISPVGNTVSEFWESLCEGKSGIDTITRFDITDFATKFAGCIKDFDPEDYMERRDARRMDRYTHYGIAATRMAMQEANFDMERIDKERLGVVIGTGVGGIETMEEQKERLLSRGPGRVSPFFVPMMISNMAAGQIAIDIGAKGVNTTVVTACASATNAIGEAYRMIRDDKADVIVTGGRRSSSLPLL